MNKLGVYAIEEQTAFNNPNYSHITTARGKTFEMAGYATFNTNTRQWNIPVYIYRECDRVELLAVDLNEYVELTPLKHPERGY